MTNHRDAAPHDGGNESPDGERRGLGDLGGFGARIQWGSPMWPVAALILLVLLGAGVVGLFRGPWPSASAFASVTLVGFTLGPIVSLAAMIPAVASWLGAWRGVATNGALMLGFGVVALSGALPSLVPGSGVDAGESIGLVFIGGVLALVFAIGFVRALVAPRGEAWNGGAPPARGGE